MNAISHEQARAYLERAADGSLGATERAVLEMHLRTCTVCRAYADELAAFDGRLTESWRARREGVHAPAGLAADVIARAGRGKARAGRLLRLAAGLAGTAALIAAVILLSGRAGRRDAAPPPPTPGPGVTVVAEPPAGTPGPTPVLVQVVTRDPMWLPPTRTPRPGTPPPWPSTMPGEVFIEPPDTHDLIYVARGMVLRWNRDVYQTEPIQLLGGRDRRSELSTPYPHPFSDPAEEYALLGVVGQSVYMAAGDRIERFDLDTGTRATVLGVPPGSDVALSPDGRWLAYISPETHIEATPAPDATPGVGPRLSFRDVQVQSLADPTQPPVPLGVCSTVQMASGFESRCGGHGLHRQGALSWSPDGRVLAWSDGYGLWRAEVPVPAQLAYTNVISGQYPHPGPWNRELDLWSPSGRYVIVWEFTYNEKGLAVIDLQTGRRAEVPQSFANPNTAPGWPYLDLAWTRAGDLLIAGDVRPVGQQYEQTLARWRVDGDAEEMLAEIEAFAFPAGPWALIDVGSPTELPDGRWAFTRADSSPQEHQTTGLFVLDPRNGSAEQVTSLPPLAEAGFDGWDAVWAPDGSGAVITNRRWPREGPFYTFPYGGLYVLRDTLGADACCFIWVAVR